MRGGSQTGVNRTLRGTTRAALPAPKQALEAAPIDPLPALDLDPLTAVDNPEYYTTQLANNTNLPPAIRKKLVALRP
jgi:hypothetical protein